MMAIEQLSWSNEKWETCSSSITHLDSVKLVLVFFNIEAIQNSQAHEILLDRYPNARIVGCSTAGNIIDSKVVDPGIVATAISFSKSRVKVEVIDETQPEVLPTNISNAMESLQEEDLKYVLILSEGLDVNGSKIAESCSNHKNITITGGLSGDDGAFVKTFQLLDSKLVTNKVILIGFYGNDLSISHGCSSGWAEFGINRRITKSKENILYEIDHQPALELYKNYLGSLAAELPASGLRFPLKITKGSEPSVIRTLLGIDEDNQSLIFAGDVPEGAMTLLMKGNTDDLILGAKNAASSTQLLDDKPGLSIVVSCVGRKMLMGPETDEELEAVKKILGKEIYLTGFYSYGELAPNSEDKGICYLHNQTMTLSVIQEK